MCDVIEYMILSSETCLVVRECEESKREAREPREPRESRESLDSSSTHSIPRSAFNCVF